MAARVKSDVVLQPINWVVGSADHSDVEVLTDVLRREALFRDFSVCLLPYRIGGLWAENQKNISVPLP